MDRCGANVFHVRCAGTGRHQGYDRSGRIGCRVPQCVEYGTAGTAQVSGAVLQQKENWSICFVLLDSFDINPTTRHTFWSQLIPQPMTAARLYCPWPCAFEGGNDRTHHFSSFSRPPCLVGGGEFVVVSWVSRLPHHRRLVVVPRCSNEIPLGSCQLFAGEDRTFAAPRRIDKGLLLYHEHVSDAHLMSTGGVAASETDTVVLSFPPLNR